MNTGKLQMIQKGTSMYHMILVRRRSTYNLSPKIFQPPVHQFMVHKIAAAGIISVPNDFDKLS